MLQNRMEYCLRILGRPAKCRVSISYFQEYDRCRIRRYDYSISSDPPNDEQSHEYGPTSMPGNGYDTYEERFRTSTVAEAVCASWILGVSRPD